MAATKPRVIATRRLPDAVEARMASLFDFAPAGDDAPLHPAALRETMRRCDVLVPTVTDRIDAGMFGQAGGMPRLIANFGAGTDHIDLAAARAEGIMVSNTPDVLTADTADLIIALILVAMRGLGSGERLLRAGAWTGWAPTNLLGRSLTGKALGIVGLGRIGQAVATRAYALGMQVRYHSRRPLSPEREAQAGGAHYHPELDAMLGEADVVALCCPYTAETHHLVDARRLRLMKPGAFLINAARGAIVDEEALVATLQRGDIAGAGLDVYPREPEVDTRLLQLPNAVLLPHLGSATVESRTAMGDKVIANILAWSRGEELPDRVA